MEFIIEGKTLKKYIGYAAEVVVPDGITEIADSAFSSCDVEQIVLPSTLVKINNDAFYGTRKLRSINLPDNLRYIGRGAFYKSGIQSIKIPPKIRRIAGELFSYSAIEEIYIPHGVKVIDFKAFSNCYHLSKIEIPESVDEIGENAFFEAKRLKEVVINNRNCILGANAFGLCDLLSDDDGFIVINNVLHKSPALYIDDTIIVPADVKCIATHALDCNGECKYCRDDGSDVTGFSKKIVLPDSLEENFSIHNSEVEEIVCYSKVNIRTMDLLGCINLKKLRIPEGSFVSQYAFGFWKENERLRRKIHIEYF